MEFVVKGAKSMRKIMIENGLEYTLVGDYFLPNLALPEEHRPIGKWGRLHREYLKQEHPILFERLILNGRLWTYLADLNEQAQERILLITEQMKASEGVTEDLKASDPMAWVGAMNSIRNRAEEIVLHELIYEEVAA
ncbi:TnpV protein [Pseudoflavonifractor phocaeensis]|nr:TnpV protein [Pseudoflavonifractor phocaeensis]